MVIPSQAHNNLSGEENPYIYVNGKNPKGLAFARPGAWFLPYTILFLCYPLLTPSSESACSVWTLGLEKEGVKGLDRL